MFPTTYDLLIQRAAKQHLPGLDWRLLKAQLMAESNLDPSAVSPVGAEGIAQFMPRTWDDMCDQLGYSDGASPLDPTLAIPAAAYYLAQLRRAWSAPRPEIDRHCLAMASYNAGFGNLLEAQRAAGMASDYAAIIAALPAITEHYADETTAYVKRILRYYNLQVTG